MRIKDYLIEHIIMEGSIEKSGGIDNLLQFRLESLARSAKELPLELHTRVIDTLFDDFRRAARDALQELRGRDPGLSEEFEKKEFTYETS